MGTCSSRDCSGASSATTKAFERLGGVSSIHPPEERRDEIAALLTKLERLHVQHPLPHDTMEEEHIEELEKLMGQLSDFRPMEVAAVAEGEEDHVAMLVAFASFWGHLEEKRDQNGFGYEAFGRNIKLDARHIIEPIMGYINDSQLEKSLKSHVEKHRQMEREKFERGALDGIEANGLNLLYKVQAQRYDCWSIFKDSYLPWQDVVLDLLQISSFWRAGQYQWLAISGGALLFNGSVTTLFEVWRGNYGVACLNMLTAGTAGLAFESRECFKIGEKSKDMLFYKVAESTESLISFILAGYSMMIAGLVENYPSLDGTTTALRLASLASSLVCLPLAGFDVDKYFILASRSRELKDELWTRAGRWRMFAFHASQVASHLAFVIFAYATRPFGIFVLLLCPIAAGSAIIIVGCLLLFLYMGVLIPVQEREGPWRALRSRTREEVLYAVSVASGAVFSPVILASGMMLTMPMDVTPALGSIFDNFHPLFLQILRVLMLAVAWSIVIHRAATEPQFASDLVSDPSHLCLLAIAAVGGLCSIALLIYQIRIGRWHGGPGQRS